MADAAGNVTPVLSHSTKSAYVPVELLYGGARLIQQGCTVAGGQGLLAVGTVLGKVTASGKYIKYVSTASDGSQVPVGVLRTEVDTGTSGGGNSQDMQANIVKGGDLNAAVMVGYDTSAHTFAASTSTAGSFDSNAQTVLRARIDATTDELIF